MVPHTRTTITFTYCASLLGILGSAALAASGCGGDQGEGATPLSAATAASFEGVYEITTMTVNHDGCDRAGDDLPGEPHVVAVVQRALGMTSLKLISCSDAADCESTAQALPDQAISPARFTMTFSTENGPDELGGVNVVAGILREGQCSSRNYTTRVLTREGDAIDVESRVTALPDRASERGSCTTSVEQARQEADSLPCTTLHQMSATRVGD